MDSGWFHVVIMSKTFKTVIKLLEQQNQNVPSEVTLSHVAKMDLVPGFVILRNANGDPIGLFNSNLVISVTQPDNDTELLITH